MLHCLKKIHSSVKNNVKILAYCYVLLYLCLINKTLKSNKKMKPTKSIYNKREIMHQAWTIYRRLGGLASFATSLRNAWRLAKRAARKAVEAAKKEAARLEVEARKATSRDALAKMRDAVKRVQVTSVDMYAWYRDGRSGQYTGD